MQAEVTLPVAGRVDICAKQVGTDAKVVIENQLGWSDNSHCLRLLGYAADMDASILVWVAAGFTSYHKRILKWLNEADTIKCVRRHGAGPTALARLWPPISARWLSRPNRNLLQPRRTRTRFMRNSTGH